MPSLGSASLIFTVLSYIGVEYLRYLFAPKTHAATIKIMMGKPLKNGFKNPDDEFTLLMITYFERVLRRTAELIIVVIGIMIEPYFFSQLLDFLLGT